MTTRDIAYAVSKDERTVQRWVKKLSDKMSSINDKMSASSPMSPADYDEDEVLAIIECGLGKNAAGVYRANAQMPPANSTPAIDYEKLATTVATAVMVAMSQQNQVSAQPQIEHKPSHMTLVGFCRTNQIKYDGDHWLRSTGMVLRGICNQRGIEVTKIPDQRYGHVNGYPLSVLEEYFHEF